MHTRDNNDNKQSIPEKRNIVIACKLTNTEKKEFNKLMKSSGFKTPSETIRYAIKEALNNVC